MNIFPKKSKPKHPKDAKLQKSEVEIAPEKHQSNIMSRTYRFIRSKMILHAIPHTDWPDPHLIFGSDKPIVNTKSFLGKSSAGQSNYVDDKQNNSSELSTIVSGFMQFEKSFKRRRGLDNFKRERCSDLNSSCRGNNFCQRMPKESSSSSSQTITIPSSTELNHFMLGEAIEQCLKSKQKQ